MALCHGSPSESTFQVEASIARTGEDGGRAIRMISDAPHAQQAVTLVETLAGTDGAPRDGGALCLLRASPKTGRTHQLRLHLSHVGHGIVDDTLYGTEEERQAQGPGIVGRLALHAHELTLTHPATGKEVTFRAPLPMEMRAAAEKAGLKVPQDVL